MSRSPDSGDTRPAPQAVEVDETRRLQSPAPLARVDSQPPAFTPGDTLGRYVLLRELGAGGMSVVYVAYDPELDRHVALKLMRTRAKSSAPSEERPRSEQRLLREAQALARLSHRNVVHVYDVGVVDNQVYMAMELVEGQTLRQWLDAEPRVWAEILDVLRRAGQGLAAAHEAGLVHLDFKPGNVLVGADGRIRVVDFGLAREPRRPGDSLDPALLVEPEPIQRSGRLAEPLTEDGSVMGTPGYIAPEQLRGDEADARADQFSFCVALWEAFYGERPFQGESRAKVQRAVLSGRTTTPKSDRGVPHWLRRILMRGLQVKPGERFEDMQALLAALSRDPGRRRLRALVVAIGAGAAGFALFGYYGLLMRAEIDCGQGTARMEQVWGPVQHEAGRSSFERTGLAYSADAWRAAADALDSYSTRWAQMHADACEATHKREEQSAELLDLRMLCLEKARDELAALVELLLSADAPIVENALRAADALSPVSECSDVAALRTEHRLPDDTATRAAVEALEGEIRRAKAMRDAAHYDEARELAEASLVRAKALAHMPTMARAALTVGLLHTSLGQPEEGAAAMFECVEFAEATGMDVLRVHALVELVYILGIGSARHEEALWYAQTARAAIARLGNRDRELIQTLANEAVVFAQQGRFDESLASNERALLLTESVPIGLEAVAAIVGNLGSAYFQRGDYRQALRHYQRAYELRKQAVGPKHPSLANTLENVGNAYQGLGRYDEGLSELKRALALNESAGITSGVKHATLLNNVAVVLNGLERYDEAMGFYERSLQAYAEKSPGHPMVGVVLCNLAELDLEKGDPRKALGRYHDAREILETTLGEEHPYTAVAMSGEARCKLDLGRLEEALPQLERALAILDASPGDATVRAEAAFQLARALARTEDPVDKSRALDLVREARTVLRESGPRGARALARVEDWIRDNP